MQSKDIKMAVTKLKNAAIPPTITVIKKNFLIPSLFPWTTPRMRQINKNIICNKAPAILEIFFQ